MIRVHFPSFDRTKPAISLAAALRFGGLDQPRGRQGPEEGKYDRLNAEAPKCFEVVDLDRAEVIVYPHRADPHDSALQAEIEAIANEARQRSLGCIFFSWGDVGDPVRVSYGTVYQQSLFADRRLANEQTMPAEISDPLEELGIKFRPRDLDMPSVGFCGYVGNPLSRLTYRMMGRTRKFDGLELRARALRSLKRVKEVRTDFIRRQMYRAGMRGRFHHFPQREFKSRREFWNNVLNNDYTLCLRGAGNFSYRFYEALAAGRIPLFINTDCILPFEDQIDWKKHCVWVEALDIDQAGQRLLEFHSQLSPEKYWEFQIANRLLWETKLSPLGFYQTVIQRHVGTKPQ
jgi:hypothetical protein